MIEMLLTERDVGGHGRNLGADLLASGSNCAARCPGSVLHKASFCKPHSTTDRRLAANAGLPEMHAVTRTRGAAKGCICTTYLLPSQEFG